MFGFIKNMFSLRKLFARQATLPQIKYKKYAGYKYPAKITVTSPHPIDCEIEPYHTKYDDYPYFLTTLYSGHNSEVGTHRYYIDHDIMYGIKIETKFSQRGQGFGEFMRLLSLITMKENNLREIKIESLLSAIPFHRKYFFEPDIEKNSFPIKILLTNIKNDETLPPHFRTATKGLLRHPQEHFIRKVNSLIAKIMDKHLLKRKHLMTPDGYIYGAIPMRLKRSNVNKNKDFFNALFKKHGIDYEI